MSASDLLDRLQHVRRSGPGKWRAQCPVHGGMNKQSLAIKEKDDGSVLLHCFSHECSAADIVAAVGLELTDLFPPRDLPEGEHRRKPERKPWTAYDILGAMRDDVMVAAVIVCDVAKRGSATDDERADLLDLGGRLNALASMAGER